MIQAANARSHQSRDENQSVVFELIFGDDVDDLSDVRVKPQDFIVARHHRDRAEHYGDVGLQEGVEVLGEESATFHVEINFSRFSFLWIYAEHRVEETAEMFVVDACQMSHHQLVFAVAVCEELGELEGSCPCSLGPKLQQSAAGRENIHFGKETAGVTRTIADNGIVLRLWRESFHKTLWCDVAGSSPACVEEVTVISGIVFGQICRFE